MMDKQVSEYCTGCGLCACQNKAVLRKDEKGFLYPESGDKEWLKKVCPTMSFLESDRDINKIWGREEGVYLGWSTDPSLREKASSGGILTELASFLLDENKVDCVIHICKSADNPTKTEICYSYNREELEKRCGSRYAISHPLAELDKIDFEKTYAFIGKPCDIVALKNFMKLNPILEKNILYTMSFFCMGLPSEKAQENLLLQLGCETNSCKDLQYRGNGWPGFTTAVDENGKNYKMDYDTSWGKILGRDLMPACRFCLDGIGEMADVACGDAWYLTDSGQADFSEHAGRNVIFARTKKGLELIRKAQEKQRIEMKEYNNYENSLMKIQKSQYERRIAMRARVLALKIMRKPYPVYSHKILKKYASKLTKGKQLRICLGTCKRIIKGKI